VIADPCPYCGRLFTARARWMQGKSAPIKVRDIEDHSCAAFRQEPELPPTDPTFAVVPERSEDDLAYAMHRYRRSIRER
jgi:hypothetical protein